MCEIFFSAMYRKSISFSKMYQQTDAFFPFQNSASQKYLLLLNYSSVRGTELFYRYLSQLCFLFKTKTNKRNDWFNVWRFFSADRQSDEEINTDQTHTDTHIERETSLLETFIFTYFYFLETSSNHNLLSTLTLNFNQVLTLNMIHMMGSCVLSPYAREDPTNE